MAFATRSWRGLSRSCMLSVIAIFCAVWPSASTSRQPRLCLLCDRNLRVCELWLSCHLRVCRGAFRRSGAAASNTSLQRRMRSSLLLRNTRLRSTLCATTSWWITPRPLSPTSTARRAAPPTPCVVRSKDSCASSISTTIHRESCFRE